MANNHEVDWEGSVAIVGMAAHLPDATTPDGFWQNLLAGKESSRSLSDDELIKAGVSKAHRGDPRYVKRAMVLDDLEYFDADFFGFSPKEAGIMDPQHRHFLETCWEALEDSGHVPSRFDGAIGVYGGCGMAGYFMFNVLTNPQLVDSVGLFLLRHTSNDKDFLVTRASYCLDLKGPSVNVQTACSTSLVATHLATQALLSGECDMALAGGVTIEVPHAQGYMYQEGEVLSPDGYCRAFDHRAQGTVFGSGSGVVALRRMEDAVRDGDHIYAVIRGSAINNDGASKVGYLAPSVEGQTAAISEAIEIADISAESIGYVECHGTGTKMGDPIELTALTDAFGQSTQAKGFCRIGSAKTNIGHLDTAAGVVGLMKASMAVYHGQIPPTLNYSAPNPDIDFAGSPFVVNDQLHDWDGAGAPRRAAVNSLGVGGTNAFAIVEQPPARPASPELSEQGVTLVWSARKESSIKGYANKLADFLEANPGVNMGDVATTLWQGRHHFDGRASVHVRDREDAISALRSGELPRGRIAVHKRVDDERVVFSFPGGGCQHVGMARHAYEVDTVVRQWMDRGFDWFEREKGVNLKALMWGERIDAFAHYSDEAFDNQLEDTRYQLPAVFIVEYALTQSLLAAGIQPYALIGHSLGENTAACVAGVLAFEDALALVALRGELVQSIEGGGTTSVSASEARVRELLTDGLDIATVNGPEQTSVSGSVDKLAAFEARLSEREVDYQRIKLTVPAHSRMLDRILDRFQQFLESVTLSAPTLPIISNRTGEPLTAEQATNPVYWREHLRHTVLFSAGVEYLLDQGVETFVEVGPNRILTSLVRQISREQSRTPAMIAALPHPNAGHDDGLHWQGVLGQLWSAGRSVDLGATWHGERFQHISLPTYAFARQRYWIEPGQGAQIAADDSALWPDRVSRVEDWFWQPVWRPKAVDPMPRVIAGHVLMFVDDYGFTEALADYCRQQGAASVTMVRMGDGFRELESGDFIVPPEFGYEGYHALLEALAGSERRPSLIIHGWLLTGDERFRPGSSFFHRTQECGFYSVFFLAKALQDESADHQVQLTVLGNGALALDGEAVRYPEKATILGPVKVIPREMPEMRTLYIDLPLPEWPERSKAQAAYGAAIAPLVKRVQGLIMDSQDQVCLIAGDHVWSSQYQGLPETALTKGGSAPRTARCVLITGGLGDIGLAMAEQLAAPGVSLVLLSRRGLDDESRWDGVVEALGASHPKSQQIMRLRRLQEKGARIFTPAVDVIDRDTLLEVKAEIESLVGPIDGVVHAAGLIADDLIAVKTQSSVEDVFTTKLHGTLVLDDIFQQQSLAFFIAFSSTSAAVAPIGQVDYVAANVFLNQFARSRQLSRPWKRVLALGWGVWKNIGMAARALENDGAATLEPVDQPMWNAIETTPAGVCLHGTLSPDTHWLLDEHRTPLGQALVPGTGIIELMVEGWRGAGRRQPVELQSLMFFQALYVADHQSVDIRLQLDRLGSGYRAQLQSRVVTRTGSAGWLTHAEAELSPVGGLAPETVEWRSLLAGCAAYSVPRSSTPIIEGQAQILQFGPRWQVLREVHYGHTQALGVCELPEAYQRETDNLALHPALLDIATGFAMRLIPGYDPTVLWMPVSYNSLKVIQSLPAAVWCVVDLVSEAYEHDDGIARFDVKLCDELGVVRVMVESLTVKRLAQMPDFAQRLAPENHEVTLIQDGSQVQRSPAEAALWHNYEAGITEGEGRAAFAYALAMNNGPSDIVVSSIGVSDLEQQLEAVSAKSASDGDDDTAFDRPELDTDYAPPTNELESELVEQWQTLLGVAQVGIHDNFFDLGGHSLIAVRLFARIKKHWHVDFPISVLFEAPTVSSCAELIADAMAQRGVEAPTAGQNADGSSGAKAGAKVATTARRRFTHLVAMHEGEPKAETPFFLVAGMFGNVLNLRHLANLVGTDRPFFGIQAKGLYGDEPPHVTFEAMAHDYIEEMRRVQPHGPYMIGGFSGGGITAYEIARQLMAAGESIALLVMLDTPLPQDAPLSMGDKLAVHKQRLQNKGFSYITEWAGSRYRWEVNRWKDKLGLNPEVELSQTDFHNDAIEIAFRTALDAYAVSPLDVWVTHFRPRLPIAYTLKDGRVLNEDREVLLADNGWTPYVKGMDTYEVPGDHDSMVLEPNVRVLAARLKQCIKKVEQSAEGAMTTQEAEEDSRAQSV